MPDPQKLTRPAGDVGDGPWCDCCRAEIEPGGVLWFFDRHGDPECLCSGCYERAVNPQDSTELQRRDWTVAWWLAVMLALVLLWLSGCASFQPRVEIVALPNGQVAIEHIDTDDHPRECGDRTAWSGCHMHIAGISHIWRSSMVAEDTIDHERAHAMGMEHTDWRVDFLGRRCALVTRAGGRYRVGQVICIDRRGEFTMRHAEWMETK